jgi:hypothetical protein
MAKHCFEQIIERDLAAMRVHLRLGGDEVRFADIQFRSVLNNEDTVALWESIGQNI